MSLTRLQELASLHQATQPTQVDEAKKSTKTFHGVYDFVNDSLADLQDSIGKGGTICSMADAAQCNKLAAALATFKKTVEQVMTDIEVDVMAGEAAPAKKLSEGQLVEAKDYEDSGDFTNELSEMGTAILKLKQMTRQPRWKNWMRVTDDNFSTSCVALEKDLTEKLGELDKAYDALEDELHSAG